MAFNCRCNIPEKDCSHPNCCNGKVKKEITELTKLERHWVLAECLGEIPWYGTFNNITQMYLWCEHTKTVWNAKGWNPDKDKVLMWDLEKELDVAGMRVRYYPPTKSFEVPLTILRCKEKEEAVQLAYIYHKLGNFIDVPEGLG